ncbi:protein phosphatase 2C 23 [Tripterygium wilfordii]|uniref:Protein phosphatase 2C 23 n=1 Tax=Tripterygium wilfordii TaxID=458696 RepID=A0A7J7DE73_TRIWF|nr:protein phosphatase 2C 23 [Tripterygium wilfordii]
MGNGFGKFTGCFTGSVEPYRRQDISVLLSDPLDEGLGHSFCYVRPVTRRFSSSKVHSEEPTTFRTISGASVSANTSTPLSTSLVDPYACNTFERAAAFESSNSFASIPLQPIPRNLINSGPISANYVGIPGSCPLERGFMSGPIERGFTSGPLDRGFSGPLEKRFAGQFQRSFSHGGMAFRPRSRRGSLIRVLQRAISKKINRGNNSIVAPIMGGVKESDGIFSFDKHDENLTISSINLSSEGSLEDEDSLENQNLQWAQGKAGEDRVHVVVSEESGWVFVGIYDGFNGPDAPDYLLSNLYAAVRKELKGLLWDVESSVSSASAQSETTNSSAATEGINEVDCSRNCESDACSRYVEQENRRCVIEDTYFTSKSRRKTSKCRGASKKWEENQRRWKCEWDRERLELDRRLKEQLNYQSVSSKGAINHGDVLKALSQALKKTEDAYFDIADRMLMENPELALMGSCVLVMLMKGDDVYVMNVGDSRAVLAQKAEPDYWSQDLGKINEETLHDLDASDCEQSYTNPSSTAFQLSVDHSTSIEEEVQRIKNEHRDDALAVLNDRVKGSLKVTRAFGAGFLKQFFGVTIELFIALQPEGDPAQHLVEEVLFRAAKKAGMDFHELLEIPQGDRRRYHDDVSIIVISLEGRIWRSCV